jgi:hypothetical protein
MSGEPMAFLQAALSHDNNNCVLWPFSLNRKGYGQLEVDGKIRRAHRVVCEKVYGPAPASQEQAAHSCGIPSCINWRHLRWASYEENRKDAIEAGTSGPGELTPWAKLNGEQVLLIRSFKGKDIARLVAERFGVARKTIDDIWHGRTWKHI